eukprot:m.259447 g.259447  ORF g.259447 m.259447 type:complete len:379 (+) comp40421_c0_seq6:409-1545(+)
MISSDVNGSSGLNETDDTVEAVSPAAQAAIDRAVQAALAAHRLPLAPALRTVPSATLLAGLRTADGSQFPPIERSGAAQLGNASGNSTAAVPAVPQETPFIVGDAILIPAKLVAKILSGKFVDMAELMADNVELVRVNTETSTANAGSSGRTRLRQVPTVLSWARSFCAFAAVRASANSKWAVPMFAHMALILQETARCGGDGWRGYDARFRQMAAASLGAPWGTLNSGLFAQTFFSLQAQSSSRCTNCNAYDHQPAECSLAHLQPGHDSRHGRGEKRAARDDNPPICRAYNSGKCTFQNCKFRHICANCYKDHRSRDCRGNDGAGGDSLASRQGAAPWCQRKRGVLCSGPRPALVLRLLAYGFFWPVITPLVGRSPR